MSKPKAEGASTRPVAAKESAPTIIVYQQPEQEQQEGEEPAAGDTKQNLAFDDLDETQLARMGDEGLAGLTTDKGKDGDEEDDDEQDDDPADDEAKGEEQKEGAQPPEAAKPDAQPETDPDKRFRISPSAVADKDALEAAKMAKAGKTGKEIADFFASKYPSAAPAPTPAPTAEPEPEPEVVPAPEFKVDEHPDVVAAAQALAAAEKVVDEAYEGWTAAEISKANKDFIKATAALQDTQRRVTSEHQRATTLESGRAASVAKAKEMYPDAMKDCPFSDSVNVAYQRASKDPARRNDPDLPLKVTAEVAEKYKAQGLPVTVKGAAPAPAVTPAPAAPAVTAKPSSQHKPKVIAGNPRTEPAAAPSDDDFQADLGKAVGSEVAALFAS